MDICHLKLQVQLIIIPPKLLYPLVFPNSVNCTINLLIAQLLLRKETLPLKKKISFISERGERRERGKETSMCERHQLVASRTPLTADLEHNPGMCPHQQSNWRPLGFQTSAQPT